MNVIKINVQCWGFWVTWVGRNSGTGATYAEGFLKVIRGNKYYLNDGIGDFEISGKDSWNSATNLAPTSIENGILVNGEIVADNSHDCIGDTLFF